MFDGTNPHVWVDRCEMFFELYSVTESLKTRFAALNFTGVAASWLQTYELRGRVTSWSTLCKAVCDRFDLDQYQTFLRQLDSLKQTGSMTEYYEQFEHLSHSILLYNSSYDDTYFVTRFLGGLRDDIRSIIALHRPSSVDTTSALAILQEEELAKSKVQSTLNQSLVSSIKVSTELDFLRIKPNPVKRASQWMIPRGLINWTF